MVNVYTTVFYSKCLTSCSRTAWKNESNNSQLCNLHANVVGTCWPTTTTTSTSQAKPTAAEAATEAETESAAACLTHCSIRSAHNGTEMPLKFFKKCRQYNVTSKSLFVISVHHLLGECVCVWECECVCVGAYQPRSNNNNNQPDQLKKKNINNNGFNCLWVAVNNYNNNRKKQQIQQDLKMLRPPSLYTCWFI